MDLHKGVYTSGEKIIKWTCIEVNVRWLENFTKMDSHGGVYSSGKKNHRMV